MLKVSHKSWVEDVACNVDIFRQEYCGYWARGMEYDDELGWLALDMVERRDTPPTEECVEAFRAWRAGEKLPRCWYRFDRALGERALDEGLKKYGEDFPENYDGPMADVAMQRAVFGEVIYG